MFDLELVALRKVYPGGTEAVRSFDLKVEPGEFISFVGPSGCGKTTTLRMIAGLESITDGRLMIKERDFTDVPAEKRPTATIFQNYAIFPHMSVRENVAFGLGVRGLARDEIERRTNAILQKFELSSVADAREASLSGGQRQRIALARGLVTEPDILLLDEPLGALDANLRKAIQEELKILQRELGITFVFVTHAQSEALGMGDRVVVMNAGRVEQISPPFELYTRPRTPFVARFIGRNQMIGGKLLGADAGRATVSTRFGDLSGMPAFAPHEAPANVDAFAVTPSEYIELLPHQAGGAPEGSQQVEGEVVSLDAVGRVVQLAMRLDEGLTVRIEIPREAVDEAAMQAGSRALLRWPVHRTTIVLDAA